jgi:hypothetical protein
VLAPLTAARSAVERLGRDRLERGIYPDAYHEIFNELNLDEALDNSSYSSAARCRPEHVVWTAAGPAAIQTMASSRRGALDQAFCALTAWAAA